MSEVTGPQQVTAEQESSSAPTLTVASFDNSIPLGDSFPVAIDITNAAPNEELELEIEGGGIIPSVTKASVTTDSSGNAQVRLSARATQPSLDALHVVAHSSSDTLMGSLYTNFEEPYVEGAELRTQSQKPVGEPLTVDEYYETLPVARTEEEVEAFNEDPSPPKAYILDGVQFKNVDGKLEKKFDAVVLDGGTEYIDTTSAQSQPSLSAQACTVKPTHVILKTVIDTRPTAHIKGTRVRIDTYSEPTQVRYVGDNGRIDFNYSCSTKVSFQVDSWTNTGMYMHTGKDILLRERLFAWKKDIAAGGKVFNADNIRGTTVRTDGDTLSIDSQRLFWKTNQVYDWERRSHSLYDTFPLDTYYPYTGFGGLSGVGRTHIPGAGARLDPLIFHEFGHEVYYRRMLGGAEYGRLHQAVTILGRTPAYPVCLDALGWKPWAIEGHCAGMLEGFALWFETVSTYALGAGIDRSFDPEFRPTTGTQTLGHHRPGSVAQFLMDVTDSHSTGVLPNRESSSIDPVRQLDANISVRYRNVAQFFHHGRIEASFTDVWKNMFKPRLSKSELVSYCVVKKHNVGIWAGDGC